MCKDRQSVNSFSKPARFSKCRRVFSKNLNLHLWFQTTNEPVAQLIVHDATDLLSNSLHGVDVLLQRLSVHNGPICPVHIDGGPLVWSMFTCPPLAWPRWGCRGYNPGVATIWLRCLPTTCSLTKLGQQGLWGWSGRKSSLQTIWKKLTLHGPLTPQTW